MPGRLWDKAASGGGTDGKTDGAGYGATDRGKVVAMDRFRSGKSLSPLRQAEAYWTALREGGGVPMRGQIDPRGLANILEHAFILERIAPSVARFRLAGQHVCDLLGMELRGMPLTALFTPAARTALAPLTEQVFDLPAVLELSLISARRLRDRRIEAHAILLPLRSDAGRTDRALGVLVADPAGPVRHPVRFDLAGEAVRPVNGAAPRNRPQPRPEPGTVTQGAPGFAESQAPLSGRAPHLRVVK